MKKLLSEIVKELLEGEGLEKLVNIGKQAGSGGGGGHGGRGQGGGGCGKGGGGRA